MNPNQKERSPLAAPTNDGACSLKYRREYKIVLMKIASLLKIQFLINVIHETVKGLEVGGLERKLRKSAATTLPTRNVSITIESFQMRYLMKFYLKRKLELPKVGIKCSKKERENYCSIQSIL